MSKRPSEDDDNSCIQPTRVKSRRSSDRIVLDVGGREFVTSISTLTSNSSYFESMLSHRWSGGNSDDDDDDDDAEKEESRSYFLDQNPDAFTVILNYMRERMVEVDALDSRVLALSEFLGVESLLAAVKVKVHCALNPTYAGTEEDAIQAFHEKYGTIKQAIVCGDLPKLLQHRRHAYDRDYATLTYPPQGVEGFRFSIQAEELDRSGVQRNFPLVGAINWLHAHGYDTFEKDIIWKNRYGDDVTFSRRKRRHKNGTYQFEDLLIEPNQEPYEPRRTFALCMTDTDTESTLFYGPGKDEDDGEGDDGISQWFLQVNVESTMTWLRGNGYVQRELEMEKLFDGYVRQTLFEIHFSENAHQQHLQFQIYSKPL